MIHTLASALDERGYTELTPVQTAVMAPELNGVDMLVSAQTGSGKTLGFGLAIAPTVLDEDGTFPRADKPLALIIAPTRELAIQVKRELSWLYAKAGAILASCVGGMDMRDERRSLARGAHVVVATPGRLRDHIMRETIDLSAVQAVVLDEADEMLDLGFREDLEFILEQVPQQRQTLLFSATVPKSIAALAQKYQRDAVRVKTISESKQHSDIEYQVMSVAARDGENAIINTLRFFEAPNAIVFCNTRAMVNRLTTRLSNRGLSVVALSGELTQSERTHALQAMRDGRARICVATDVAARGIDLPNLDLVVHAELPSNHETLLHRSGRTGRAGRKGVSALIVPPSARKKAQRILGGAKLKADWGNAPTSDEVRAADRDRMMSDPAWAETPTDSMQSAIDDLTSHFTPQQIAAAFLRIHSERFSAPEDLAMVDDKPKPRAEFGPSVWFSLPGGRKTNAEPRRILPMLCKMGNIDKHAIGAIRVQNDASYFEISTAQVDKFCGALGDALEVEDGQTLTRLDKAPDFSAPARAVPKRAKPHRGKPGPKADYKTSTPPVDWNDDPQPKPKAAKKPRPAKHDKPKSKSDIALADGSLKPKKPKKPKGNSLPTPVGKPNSKKNKARRAAAQATGASGKGKSNSGGMGAPKRRK